MRAATASKHDRLKRLFWRHAAKSAAAGLTGIRFSDVGSDGATIRIDGRPVVNFGSCSYLGLAVDERLKKGAIEATERFGPLYSSSQTYSAIDLYDQLEEALGRMTDAPGVVIPATTTLGHLSCLPTLVGEQDAVVLDSHSHASLQLTVQVLASRGIPIRAVAHGNLPELESALAELSPKHRSVWYLADGVYSMLGDLSPIGSVAEAMEAFPNLFVYYDDAHGFSWAGRHGRGYVLSQLGWSERLVVAVGLAKSFGSGGAALFFGDPAAAAAVRHLGGPMTFSGPIHPPTLGAAVASASIHLSDEHEDLRRRINDQIGLVARSLASHQLPVVAWAPTPIWMVRIGDFDRVLEIAGRMLADGYYLNVTAFPAVPVGMAGLRFTHTLRQSPAQIEEMIGLLAEHVTAVAGEPAALIDLHQLQGPGGGLWESA